MLVEGIVYPDLKPSKRSDCGVVSTLTASVKENITQIHETCKGSLTLIAMSATYLEQFGNAISPSTISRYVKKMGAKMCTSYIKPSLSIKQKIAGLEFIVGKVEHTGHEYCRFVDQKHVNHVDEKWLR